MPSLSAHKQQLLSNEEFFKELNDNNSAKFDWFITVMFYTILHYADAYCAKLNNGSIIFQDHDQRQKKLISLIDKKYYTMYMQLKDSSRRARYDAELIGKRGYNYWHSTYNDLYSPLRVFFQEKIL